MAAARADRGSLMRVLLTGGGTAGHINPALAIADTIKQNAPHAEIAFAGVKTGKEADLIPREGYPLYFVDSMGFSRPIYSPVNIKAAWLAFYSPRSPKTRAILKEFQPDIVIGTGGYACYPLMAAAVRMQIPCALHESNALPGLAIRKLQGKVDRIWLHFPQSAEHLTHKEKILTVGNPLRRDFGAITKQEARRRLGIPQDKFVILSFGGSLGAETLNDAVLEVMKELSCKRDDILHLHATGKRDHARLTKALASQGLADHQTCTVKEYIYDMPLQMAASDLVISRAGAMTLSELARLKKACILIPSPYVADNHQYLNAKVIADAGGAILIEEKELASGTLTKTVTRLYREREALPRMEGSIASFAELDANQKIWNDILELLK